LAPERPDEFRGRPHAPFAALMYIDAGDHHELEGVRIGKSASGMGCAPIARRSRWSI